MQSPSYSMPWPALLNVFAIRVQVLFYAHVLKLFGVKDFAALYALHELVVPGP